YQTFGFFQNNIGHPYMFRSFLVKSRGNDLPANIALHVRNFLRTFIYQKDNLINFRMIGGNTIGNILQKHGLARFWLGYDHTSLTFADWAEQIYNSCRYGTLSFRKIKFFLWE